MKKMNLFFKKISLFAAFLVSFLGLWSVFGFNAFAEDSVDTSTPMVLTISTDNSVYQDSEGNIHVTPVHKRISFTLTASNMDTSDYMEFTYLTIDYTACSGMNDYTSVLDTEKLTAKSNSITVNLDGVGSQTFAYRKNGYTNYDCFIFEVADFLASRDYQIVFDSQGITKVFQTTVDDVTTNDQSGAVYCDLTASHVFDIHNSEVNDYLEIYSTQLDNNANKKFKASAYDTTSVTFDQLSNLQTLLDDYVRSGLAEYYFATQLKGMDESISTCGDLWIYLRRASKKNGDNMMRLYFDRGFDDTDFSFEEIAEDDTSDCDFDAYPDNYTITIDGSKRKIVQASYGTSTVNEDCQPYVYVDNDDPPAWSTASRSGTVYVAQYIQDYKKPTITNASVDSNHYAVDDTVSCQVRFSEPVKLGGAYLSGANEGNLYVQATISTTKTIYFKYAGGSGTDTLYFELPVSDLPSGYDISTISLTCFVTKNGDEYTAFGDDDDVIEDYGRVANKFHNSSSSISLGFNDFKVNMCDPDVTITDDETTESSNCVTAEVSIGAATRSATMYYVWTQSPTFTFDNYGVKTVVETPTQTDYVTWCSGSESKAKAQFLKDYFMDDSGNYLYDPIRIRNVSGKSAKVIQIPSKDADGNKLVGEWFLHVYVVSCTSRVAHTVNSSTTGYLLDPDAPVVGTAEVTGTNQSKKIVLEASDAVIQRVTSTDLISGLDCAYLSYYTYSDYKMIEGSLKIYDSSKSSSTKLYDETTGKFTFTITYENLNMLYEDEECVDEDGNPDVDSYGYPNRVNHGYYYFTITIKDKTGNETSTKVQVQDKNDPNKYVDYIYYDTRPIFEIEPTTSLTPFQELTEESGIYQIGSSGLTVSASLDSGTSVSGVGLGISNLTYKGIVLYDNYEFNAKNGSYQCEGVESTLKGYSSLPYVTDVVTVSYAADKLGIELTFLQDGYYSLTFGFDGTKYSKTFEYYLTTKFDDNTENYSNFQSAHYVKSKVFQLTTQYSYIGSDWTKGIKTMNYNGTSSDYPVSFSTEEKAKKYIKYMEMQDMYAVLITSSAISGYLNSGGSTEYIKADGETHVATTNEVWIRYKSTSWSTDSKVTQWVYYYYGPASQGTAIKSESELPELLQTALNTVTDYIASLGQTVYLGTEDYTGTLGQCYLKDNQYFTETITASETMSGSRFATEIKFAADKDIYSDYYQEHKYDGNVIKYTGSDAIKFLQHLELVKGMHTKIYIAAYYDGMANVTDPFSNDLSNLSVNLLNCTYLDDAITSIGGIQHRFMIMELNDDGVSIFEVYYDNSAPSLEMTYQNKDESGTTTSVVDASSYTSMGVRFITFNSILCSEADPYSYITIYKKYGTGMGTVLASYTVEDLLSAPAEIPDGSYYVKVSDRYGNSYTFTVNQNSTDLVCSAANSDGEYFLVKCNREDEEILTYKIELNGEVLTEDYSKSAKFTKSGIYKITITDIYGNTWTNGNGEYFQRDYPDVTWAYLVNGDYVTYKTDESGNPVDGQGMTIEEIDTATYKIISSSQLRFTISSECSYSFQNKDIEVTKSSTAGGTNRYVINSTETWTIDIWYTENPDVVIEYQTGFDYNAPEIVASYETKTYVLEDEESLTARASATGVTDKTIFNPVSYKFIEKENSTTTNTIKSGETITAESVSVVVSDENNIRSLYIYKDDSKEPISPCFPESVTDSETGEVTKKYYGTSIGNNGSDTIILTESGTYKIVTEDIFGNTTNLVFTLEEIPTATRVIDGKTITTASTAYGNTSYEVILSKPGTFNIQLVEGKSSYVYTFLIGEKIVARSIYQVYKTDSGTTGWGIQDLYKLYDAEETVSEKSSELKYQKGTWYEVPIVDVDWYAKNYNTTDFKTSHNITDDANALPFTVNGTEEMVYLNITIEIMVDDSGTHFRFTPTSTDRETINISYFSEAGNAPVDLTTIISKEVTDVDIYENGEQLETNQDGNVIAISSPLEIENISDLVERIRISYSETDTFSNYTTIYAAGTLNQPTMEDEGYYCIQIINKFGNILKYTFVLSNSMLVSLHAIYSDGTENVYGNDYDEVVYSNSAVQVILYDKGGKFTLTRDGKADSFELVTKGDSISFTKDVADAGNKEITFSVIIEDSYGNTKVRTFVILKSNMSVEDDIITGYNEKALLREEGYTNQKLSIDYSKIASNSICYIAITHENVTKVVYDQISETHVNANDVTLTNCIGNDGDGEYIISFRDIYGNKKEVSVHYSATPTLTVKKNTRSDITFTECDLLNPDADGWIEIWGNNVISLTSSTVTSMSVLRIDGMITQAPYKFAFDQEEGYKEAEHEVYYEDEYGFILNIKIHQVRQDMDISLAEGTNTKTIDHVLTTNDDIVVTFTDDAECYYQLDGGLAVKYEAGDVLKQDGLYDFTVTDKAGNIGILEVCKDTSLEYSFTETSSSVNLINGAVSTTGSVMFYSSNDDTSYIYAVIKDGKAYTLSESDHFTVTGKYEVLIRDEMGNEGYFMFYIITHEISSLDYAAPAGYEISEFWHYNDSGIRESYLEIVTDNAFNATDNGEYLVILKSTVTNKSMSFSFTVDNTPSSVTLVGCSDGDTTLNTITLANYAVGDTIQIYKDGTLTKTIVVDETTESPSITDGGTYKIVVTNLAGVETTLSFKKTKVLNTYGSILIIILVVSVAFALFIGLMMRKRSRIDK